MRKGKRWVLLLIMETFFYEISSATRPDKDLNEIIAFSHGIINRVSLICEDNECAGGISDYAKYKISISHFGNVRNTNFIFPSSKLNGTIDITLEPKYVTLGLKKEEVENGRFLNKSMRAYNE